MARDEYDSRVRTADTDEQTDLSAAPVTDERTDLSPTPDADERTDLSATAVEPDTGADLDRGSAIQPVPPEAPGEPASETAVAAVEGGAEEAPEGLWPDGAVDELRRRWDAIQMRFVDDPSAVAADARALVGEAVRSLQETLSCWEQEVQEWATESDDTEELRRVVARYRRRLESIIS